MPKNSGLKLFTKTWPLKREKKHRDEERKRPLTATLEKPTILDIRYISKIDMSIVRKEFLNITNLCRLPLAMKQKINAGRPLSLLSAGTCKKFKKEKKKADPSDDSYEDDESSVIQSAKPSTRLNAAMRSTRAGTNNHSVICRLKQNNILALKNSVNDANNNKTLKVPSRKPNLTTIRIPNTRLSSPDQEKSTKLPSPCKTCGRPDQPERFHSHPATPMKSSPRNGRGTEHSKPVKIPVKSIVQKPIAIKYKSKTGNVIADNRKATSPVKTSAHLSHVPPNPAAQVSKLPSPANRAAVVSKLIALSPNSDKTAEMQRKSVTPSRGGSGKRTLTCYICGREFGTASLALHEPKCLQKWERENANLPAHLRRKPPVKPQGDVSQKEWNQLAWESSQATLIPCKNCDRTFYPDRLEVHLRSCRVQLNNSKSYSSDTLHTSSSPKSQSSKSQSATTSSKSNQQPQSIQCYICGKMFGTHSIKIHEKQCLKKWHIENESLPHDMRSPAPLRTAKNQHRPPNREPLRSPVEETPQSSSSPAPKSSKDDRPTSGVRSPLFPCYLCGKLFTVNSIYIHEPQCLKMWKVENDKLPLNKRRPVPLKPDIKFTESGGVDFRGTFDRIWENHLTELVKCMKCGRTFFPARIETHKEKCIGLKVEIKSKSIENKNLH
ncbi:zinc finger protein 474 isoform X2 [Dendroctonus ponderosae]|uniref:zinc finger protein 474 isoform X2 n=1 Tax=Dendroctonus ponderosae TaxID=77166 RepID=UPI0020365AE1|nr:zinc finger protein 474 isoform X2 [Dendroctonus ponderosae]